MLKLRILTYILVAILLYLFYTNVRVSYLNVKYGINIHRLSKKIDVAKIRKIELESNLEEKNKISDIEKRARIILGLIKKDEVAYQIIKK